MRPAYESNNDNKRTFQDIVHGSTHVYAYEMVSRVAEKTSLLPNPTTAVQIAMLVLVVFFLGCHQSHARHMSCVLIQRSWDHLPFLTMY